MFRVPATEIRLANAPTASAFGDVVPGFELLRGGGGSKVTFLRYDGIHVGNIPICKEATAVIDTTGCRQLHESTLRAIREGRLPKVNRLFLMKPVEGWCEEIDYSEEFWRIEPPKLGSSFSSQFLRFPGGKIVRSSIFLFAKRDFDEKGRSRHMFVPYFMPRKPSMEDMKRNLSEDQWQRIIRIMHKADIPGGSHSMTTQTVLEILSFWRAGPDDCILDIGSGKGSTSVIAAASLDAKAIGIECRDDVYSTVFDVISSIRGVTIVA
jgi:hypothetical protein